MENGYAAYAQGLDSKRKVAGNGVEFWMARDLMPLLAYAVWDKFENVIERAKVACASSKASPDNHFSQTANLVGIGSGAQRSRGDWYLSRYACYLIAMNADSSKPEVGFAMTYFAVQTRRQELSDEQKRLELRLRILENNHKLAGAAKQASRTEAPQAIEASGSLQFVKKNGDTRGVPHPGNKIRIPLKTDEALRGFLQVKPAKDMPRPGATGKKPKRDKSKQG